MGIQYVRIYINLAYVGFSAIFSIPYLVVAAAYAGYKQYRVGHH